VTSTDDTNGPTTDRPTYRERRLAKAERLRGWAEGRETKAEAAQAGARAIADLIPFGQPILAGHHSQGRHERDLRRITGGFDRAAEHSTKARDMRRRADGIEAAAERAIHSYDADAAERLTERIAELEAERDARKPGIAAYNAFAGASPIPTSCTRRTATTWSTPPYGDSSRSRTASSERDG
jgi:hypothetical protein